jgi:exopolyphosphatase / guanosine-5'-triphosphate,3'-diphosphate pyrophosphatase
METTCRVAVIELGGRAVRLLVADVDLKASTLRRIDSKSHPLPLFDAVNSIANRNLTVVHEAARIVHEFRVIAEDLGASRIQVFGTQPMRTLLATGDALSVGLESVRVIDSEFEARASFVGASAGLRNVLPSRPKSAMMFDQGVGSTEVAFGKMSSLESTFDRSYSLPGTLYFASLCERASDADALYGSVEREIGSRDWLKRLEDHSVELLVALGSPATRIAAVASMRSLQGEPTYLPNRAHARMLSMSDIERFIERAFSRKTGRRIDQGLSPPDDVWIVTGGLAVLRAMLKLSGLQGLLVSTWGVRFGLAFLIASSNMGGGSNR